VAGQAGLTVTMPSDKSYATEQRLNALVSALGPVNPSSGGGGNGQRQSLFTTANQTINSTSEVVVGTGSVPLTWNVVTGKYLLYAEITYIPNVNVDSACLRLSAQASGMTLANLRCNFKNYTAEGVVQVNKNHVTALGTDMQSSTMVSGNVCSFEFWASMNVSNAGTLSVTARILTNNADTYAIQSYSFGTLESVGQTT